MLLAPYRNRIAILVYDRVSGVPTALFLALWRECLQLVSDRILVSLIKNAPVRLGRPDHRNVLPEAPRLQHNFMICPENGNRLLLLESSCSGIIRWCLLHLLLLFSLFTVGQWVVSHQEWNLLLLRTAVVL